MNPINHDDDIFNIASYLNKQAHDHPHLRAVICPMSEDKHGRMAYTHLTFQQLDQESDCYAHGLERAGIKRGVRTILMVTPGLDFFCLVFALFKVGAVPVVVDPGMGITRMLRCLQEGRPKAFIGVSQAHVLRKLAPGFFKNVNIWVTVGKRWFWGGLTLKQLRVTPWKPFPVASTRRDEIAAILFTTGSTGPAKGAVYTHGIFDAQIRQISQHWGITPGEIDLPTFPLFALFDPALGMTAVIPKMDPTRPAHVDPENIIKPIMDQGVTNMFASPALLNRVGRYGREKGIKLPTLKRVISAGAPVSPVNIETFSTMLTGEAEIHTPYGATEAVPTVSITSNEILSETRAMTEKGFGMCVGRSMEGIDVKIIQITDDPIPEWSDDLILPVGEIGEITARGDLVSRKYFERAEADALAKIKDGDRIWHRMGDVGWLDDKGRIWFCGRKSQRVITAQGNLFTIPCEAIFNNHPRVFRSALVGLGPRGHQKPVMIIELEESDDGSNMEGLIGELSAMARANERTKNIETILIHKSFPVDIRHNAKIFREKLAVWAEDQLKK
ncbi:MAG: AMP-binding protein [Deltaproteobacteria bacterium]|nr:AMP-binding protein [Deltaproteobacteria bacterium]